MIIEPPMYLIVDVSGMPAAKAPPKVNSTLAMLQADGFPVVYVTRGPKQEFHEFAKATGMIEPTILVAADGVHVLQPNLGGIRAGSIEQLASRPPKEMGLTDVVSQFRQVALSYGISADTRLLTKVDRPMRLGLGNAGEPMGKQFAAVTLGEGYDGLNDLLSIVKTHADYFKEGHEIMRRTALMNAKPL